MLLGLVMDFPWYITLRQIGQTGRHMRNSYEGLGIIDGSSFDETAIIPIENVGIPALLAIDSEFH